jgi:hypothetical protein|tara:strand:- start:251 stop:436 length:186 start_codon:yes stop_codon:yes gene_type:complete
MKFIQEVSTLIMVIIMMALNIIWVLAGIAAVAAVLYYLWPLLVAYLIIVSIIGFVTNRRKS